MTRNWKAYARILIAGIALQCNALPALANFVFTPQGTTTMFAIDSANQGTSLCAASSTECPASVPINPAGAPIFNGTTPGIVAGSGTAGSPGTAALTIQGIGSGTAVPISAAALPLPSLAATSTLQTTINTTLGTPFQAGGSIGNTGFNALQGAAANAITNPFFQAGASPASTTMQSAAVANGPGTVLPMSGYGVALIDVVCSGCSGGTAVNFEATDSTGTFWSVQGFPVAGGTPSSAATTTSQWYVPVPAHTSVRGRIGSYSAGTVTVTGTAYYGSFSPGNVSASQNGTWTFNPTTATAWGIIADKGTFTASTSPTNLIAGEFTTSGATACATTQACAVGMTAARGLFVDLESLAGTALGAPSNYGTSPGAVAVLGVNSFITNAPNVTNTGTFAVQATLQASATTAIGKVDPNTIATWGLGATGGAVPTNTQQIGGSDGTDLRVMLMSTTGQPHIICDSGCSGSGGTSIADAGTFTAGTTAGTPIIGQFTSGGATACVTGHACWAGLTADRSVFVNLQDYAGAAISTSNPIPVQGVGVAQGSTTSGQTGSPVMMGTTTAPRTDTTAQTNFLSGNLAGQLRTVLPSYPDGATPITASATGTTAATTATLAANASLKTYICWLSIRANATAAATANSTVTGPVTGTLNFLQWTAPLASGIGLTEMVFNPCIPSSTTNTAIAVISAAPGSGGNVSVSAGGYQAL